MSQAVCGYKCVQEATCQDWVPCQKPSPCLKHQDLKCWCGEPATRECDSVLTNTVVKMPFCRMPLCVKHSCYRAGHMDGLGGQQFKAWESQMVLREHLGSAEREPGPKGYHLRSITKGVLGQASKIREELDELVDAEQQGNKILAMCELADLYGALELVAVRYGLTMLDLRAMAQATQRAFQDGSRK